MATEHRFSALEEGQRLALALTADRHTVILNAINELTTTVKAQNSRVGKLEEWKRDAQNAQSYAKGLLEGGAKVGAKQLAFLAVVGPLIFAGLDFALRHWK